MAIWWLASPTLTNSAVEISLQGKYLKLLIREGVNVNAQDGKERRTALMYACLEDMLSTGRVLLESVRFLLASNFRLQNTWILTVSQPSDFNISRVVLHWFWLKTKSKCGNLVEGSAEFNGAGPTGQYGANVRGNEGSRWLDASDDRETVEGMESHCASTQELHGKHCRGLGNLAITLLAPSKLIAQSQVFFKKIGGCTQTTGCFLWNGTFTVADSNKSLSDFACLTDEWSSFYFNRILHIICVLFAKYLLLNIWKRTLIWLRNSDNFLALP